MYPQPFFPNRFFPERYWTKEGNLPPIIIETKGGFDEKRWDKERKKKERLKEQVEAAYEALYGAPVLELPQEISKAQKIIKRAQSVDFTPLEIALTKLEVLVQQRKRRLDEETLLLLAYEI